MAWFANAVRGLGFVTVVLVVAPAFAQAPDASSVTPPRLVQAAKPVYPEGANGGTVEVELALTIDHEGVVTAADVMARKPADAPAMFDQAALAITPQLRFAPALRDGKPIAVRIAYIVHVAPPVVGAVVAPPSAAGAAAGAGSVDATTQVPRASDVPQAGSTTAGASDSNAPASVTSTGAATAVGSGASPPPSAASAAAEATAGTSAAESPPSAAGGEAAAVGEEDAYGATARSRTLTPPPAHAASDFFAPVGHLAEIPRTNAASYLQLAPGILLTNEGGEGHAERVYLRGFDAREGQDLEFTLDGTPINEVGNPHGEGYADTHFIVPELVRAVRVVEGPFDPHQGNYAVAGSADYTLGLEQRGLTMSAQAGSFDTQRLLLLWGPESERTGTFVGADLRKSDGFGQNRASELARAMGQYELQLGDARVLKVLATTYATRFGSAGVVREDDVQAGRIGFYDTYDPTQGGNAQRHGLVLSFEEHHPDWTLRQQAFVTLRDLRLRANFTGFLEDPPEPYRSGSAQRGDETDQAYHALTVGARGSMRQTYTVFGQDQSLELGYYARHDSADSSQRRLRWKTIVPYRTDFDYTHEVTNAALFLDTELRFTRWLSLRGGVRGDLFDYQTLDHCALHDTVLNSATPVVDMLCYDRDRVGPRDPTARRDSSGLAFEPRGSLLVGPFADLTFMASLGRGVRAADPAYLADGDQAPFSSILAAEGGVVWDRELGALSLNLRGVYYYTRVGQDLIFNQQEGRNTLAPGTRRQGVLFAGRARGPWFDVSASATYAHARFESTSTPADPNYVPADAGERVPFIPDWVVRADAALFHEFTQWQLLGHALRGRAGFGLSYVSPRALLFGEQGERLFLVDASAAIGVGAFELGVSIMNLFDVQYREAEFNYASEFRPDPVAPNLLPVRHFTAGAPRTVLFTLTVHLDGGKGASS